MRKILEMAHIDREISSRTGTSHGASIEGLLAVGDLLVPEVLQEVQLWDEDACNPREADKEGYLQGRFLFGRVSGKRSCTTEHFQENSEPNNIRSS